VLEAAFAIYTDTGIHRGPSADKKRHRLSRSGDRVLNSAIHIVAVTQARMPNSRGFTPIASGKWPSGRPHAKR